MCITTSCSISSLKSSSTFNKVTYLTDNYLNANRIHSASRDSYLGEELISLRNTLYNANSFQKILDGYFYAYQKGKWIYGIKENYTAVDRKRALYKCDLDNRIEEKLIEAPSFHNIVLYSENYIFLETVNNDEENFIVRMNFSDNSVEEFNIGKRALLSLTNENLLIGEIKNDKYLIYKMDFEGNIGNPFIELPLVDVKYSLFTLENNFLYFRQM